MKKTDIAMIILIAVVSVLAAFFITQHFLKDSDAEVKVYTMNKLEDGIVKPDPKIFNKDAINPAVEVQIKQSGE